MISSDRSDEQIARIALRALEWGYFVPKNLEVDVKKGWVTIKGETEWDYQRAAARNAVCDLIGVSGVTNEILV